MTPSQPSERKEHDLRTTLPECSSLALILALALSIPSAGSNAEESTRCSFAGDSGPRAPGKPIDKCGQAQTLANPALLQADVYEEGIDVSGYWVSEKLDGVRAYWNGRQLLSRRGIILSAPNWFLRDLPPIPLDGELWMGRGNFDLVSGTVRRGVADDRAWRDVRYMVFDLPQSAGPFGQRLRCLEELLASNASRYVRAVTQRRVLNRADLMTALRQIQEVGGEGLMLHRDSSYYRTSRSYDLLKLKPYLDAEARVVGHVPGKGKNAGMLGALMVENGDGRRFRIGTGFTDAQRAAPPPIGAIITYKYHGHTKTGLPRFASFLRVWDGQ